MGSYAAPFGMRSVLPGFFCIRVRMWQLHEVYGMAAVSIGFCILFVATQWSRICTQHATKAQKELRRATKTRLSLMLELTGGAFKALKCYNWSTVIPWLGPEFVSKTI